MPTPSRHFKDELQNLLDGRLDAAMSGEVERHLETCEACRREYEALRWTKQVASKRLAAAPAPADLRASILQSLRAEATASESETPKIVTLPPQDAKPWLRPLLAIAAVVLALAIVGGVWFLRQPTFPASVAQDFRDYKSRKITMQLDTNDVKEMEEFFTKRGIPFQTRVFDLGMMKYQLVGGRLQERHRRPSAAFAYRGPDGQILLCQMYPGKTTELPAGAVLRENKGIKFHIYQANGVTAVFWQEGTVVCVLASDIPQEEVVQLAFAKAMLPPGS
ncbi:MAG: zf-HC2 domain-containing protein [Chthoniobacteraceae bacterium]